ncbi:pinin [Euwallacea similis]|uniref:pinin n=1 Tax=Euwallacea similis TaxID=1736056 RepID=UPI003450B1AE
MGTEILKTFSHLQSELEEAKSSLKGVDENIKRLIGRDPSELPPRPGLKRPLDEKNGRQPFNKFGRFEGSDRRNDAPKRRNPNAISVFDRLSDKVPDEPIAPPSKGLISKVIAAPKEIPSRQEMLDKQNKDEKFKARNRRMFGALLGTLQRFQQEECKLKKREEKRTQIERKIEEHEQQEKAEIKKERQELFLNRKRKQQEIKMIELKMLRMKEYAAWEQSQKLRAHFITTKAKPQILYLPRKMNEQTNELLEKSKVEIDEHIEKRKQAVAEELSHIEDRMKRNFEPKTNTVESKVEKSSDRHNRRGSDSEMDDDEEETKEKSPSPEPEEPQEKKDEEEIAVVTEANVEQVTFVNEINGGIEEAKEEQSNEQDNLQVMTPNNSDIVDSDGGVLMKSITETNVVINGENIEVSNEVAVTEDELQEHQEEDI